MKKRIYIQPSLKMLRAHSTSFLAIVSNPTSEVIEVETETGLQYGGSASGEADANTFNVWGPE